MPAGVPNMHQALTYLRPYLCTVLFDGGVWLDLDLDSSFTEVTKT